MGYLWERAQHLWWLVTCIGVVGTPGADFDDWYRVAHPRLLAALLAFTGSVDLARDSVDEACMRAVVRWSRVGEMASPDAWVYRTAINHAKRGMRRAGLERRLLAGSKPGEEALPAPAEEIWDAVRRLPVRQRAAIILRYVVDLPEAEVAEIMKISRGTVASTLSEARRRLGQVLHDDMERLRND